MKYIEGWTESRRTHAARYNDLLADSAYDLPLTPAHLRHVYHVYAIRHPRRDALQAFLTDRGIGTNIHYPIPVHLQRCFAELGHKAGDFPHAERAANEVLSLPMYPEFQPEQQDQVVAALHEWAQQ
jgi:dTDP-4-amino-4,6-dideoxygalactose transaminase